MSSRRLSKLQRWILTAALADDELRIPPLKRIYEGFWGKERVWIRYGDRFDMKGTWRGYRVNYIDYKFRVSVSRSLKGLRDKGLIQNHWPFRYHELTDQGKAVTLTLTAMDVNNKTARPDGHREGEIHATD
jgi:hypothetical protein